VKVLVLGGGVIGITSAYHLARDGHEVTVVDRQSLAASETSYANAGLVAPGHAYAWASPKAPKILMKSLFMPDQALRLKLSADPRMWSWFWLFLMECTAERARINTIRKLGLCLYSLQALDDVVRDTGVQYDGLRGGNLYLYRSEASFAAGVDHTGILREHGLEMQVVERDALTGIEPALEPVKDKIAGAVYSPTDQSGDARMFTRSLAAHCKDKMGVELAFETTIRGVDTDGDRITGVVTGNGRLEADTYVMALGCDSAMVGRTIGLRLPIYPVKGYSVTVPIRASNAVPCMGGVDEDNLVAYCPMGERLRLTSTAEFSGYDRSHRPEDFRAMLRSARELFPSAGDYDAPDYWAGLRPMTPQGTPFLGKARYRNLFLNTGHGHIGWTMSCGSARVTADLVAGRKPDIDLTGMTYGGSA
jgi:D-amino-acid dehydrogenase